ncbi:endoplasmic reticulum mannosyl-oligosaccharide 1,2-alpha-mannosidase [Drosophila subpulchrella]|uniref:endoplasmic reticulum mannosyl-oligosaccharide 1,2-alpha-mannosidase n=1 Tax=Drosophila subpulchrella TaxID=1486046 RepID=UPI0018A174D1|nr:endoplasmic reticulum mannosyl-oligosaccharide 1,2-alpha-mannosidase [Drosophila subpulchrella]
MKDGGHITLTLSTGSPATVDERSRKSLRRAWNQLPRCQRNLIILGITAFCVTVLLCLSGDQLLAASLRDVDTKAVVSPYQMPLPNPHHHPGVDKDKDVAAAAPGPEDKRPPRAEALSDKFNELVAYGDANSAENVARLPETVAAQGPPQAVALPPPDSNREQDIGGIDILNNVEEPVPQESTEPLSEREQLDLAIKSPLNLGGVSFKEHLKKIKPLLAKGQHFHGATNERQSAVVAAFKHSWAGYKKYAWGHDNLKPISQYSHEWFGLGLTIVDSLDTMYIMGLDDEFKEARDWVEQSLRFDTKRDVNLFEVTIRVLGGLLSAYHLSGDTMFLAKAAELGNRLLPAFLSPSNIPYSDVNLGDLSAHSPKWSPDSSTSEVTTIQLEFRDLSRSTNVSVYEQVAHKVNEKVHDLDKNHGLVPIFINANTGTFRNYATISLGARGDSYYEYLLKQWIQTGRKDNDNLILDYMQAVDGVLTQLMRRTPREHWVYIGELINGKDFKPKMDHLTCYLPGTLILGHQNGMPDSHLILARDLMDTCYQTYMINPTHLAAEISYFALTEKDDQDIYVKPNDAHNLLRPEFVESLYYFYSITGNRTYQDMGWTIFQAFETHAKVNAGYTSMGNVKNTQNTRLRDLMESFWLSETLKYFYLLFSDDRKEIDLEQWVFNSEGHPLPVYPLKT